MNVRKIAGLLGLFIVVGVALMALLAPWITPHDAFAQDLNMRMVPPSFMDGGRPDHFFGTDQLGRDYLSRLIYGARISMGALMPFLPSPARGGRHSHAPPPGCAPAR